MDQNTVPVMTGAHKYKLTLNRPKNFVGCLVAFVVFIDGEKVGKIKNGKTLELEVEAGTHTISIHKNNPVNITIDRDTTADVVVFGANNFGITNINGSGANTSGENTEHYLERNVKKTNTTLIFSFIIPAVSVFMLFMWAYYIQVWVYGIVVGVAAVNIAGLKQLKELPEYKSLLTKNIIAIVVSIIAGIATGIVMFATL